MHDSYSRRELYYSDFEKNIFKIGVRSDVFESISFKLGVIIDMTNFYILIPVLIAFIFTQGHRVMRQLALNDCNDNERISRAPVHVKRAQLC